MCPTHGVRTHSLAFSTEVGDWANRQKFTTEGCGKRKVLNTQTGQCDEITSPRYSRRDLRFNAASGKTIWEQTGRTYHLLSGPLSSFNKEPYHMHAWARYAFDELEVTKSLVRICLAFQKTTRTTNQEVLWKTKAIHPHTRPETANQMTFPKLANRKKQTVESKAVAMHVKLIISTSSPLSPRYSWSVLPAGPRRQPQRFYPVDLCLEFGLSSKWSFLYNLMDMIWCVCTFSNWLFLILQWSSAFWLFLDLLWSL